MSNLAKTEYSEEFDQLRKNRVNVSQYKYGSAGIDGISIKEMEDII